MNTEDNIVKQTVAKGNYLIYKDKQIGDYKSAKEFLDANAPDVIFRTKGNTKDK